MTAEPRRFLIVGAVRSGTEFVLDALRQHPDVAATKLELAVWPLFSCGLSVFTVNQGAFEDRRALIRGAFDLLARHARPAPVRWLGGKVALETASAAFDLAVGLCDHFPDIELILVQRRDLVARFASERLADASRRWHIPAGHARTEASPVELDSARFAEFAAEARVVDGVIDALGRTHRAHRLSFEEEIVTGTALERLARYLELDGQLAPTLARTTPELSAWVINLDELRRIEAAAPPPSPKTLEDAVTAHRKSSQFREKTRFLIERAHYFVQCCRGPDAEQTLMQAFWRDHDAIQRDDERPFRLLGRAFQLIGDAALAARRLDALRPRFGDWPAFIELEAELAQATGRIADCRALAERALALATGVGMRRRLDALRRTGGRSTT